MSCVPVGLEGRGRGGCFGQKKEAEAERNRPGRDLPPRNLGSSQPLIFHFLTCGSAGWLEFNWPRLGWAGLGSGLQVSLEFLCASQSATFAENVLLLVTAEM